MFGGKRIGIHPTFVDIGVEVCAGSDCRVHVSDIKTGKMLGLVLLTSCSCNCKRHGDSCDRKKFHV